MKIYTKKGDNGTTSLIGGRRVAKYHLQIESYGTVDELIAFTGLLRDQAVDQSYKDILLFIQDRLMTCASILASDPENKSNSLPSLNNEDISFIEKEIDKMEKTLSPIQSFILPGGHPIVSYCHVCRCICRRAERLISNLFSKTPYDVLIPKLLNRLSDYYFVLGRKLSKELNIDEIPWIPRLEK